MITKLNLRYLIIDIVELIKLMSIEKTEEFIYFQNKAKHYDNIRKIKPTVDDQLSKSMRNTMDHTSPPNKKYK